MLETSARLLELLALLQARRAWTGPELADRLEVGVRTVRRDIDRLRRLGYPVAATPGVAGGYELAAGTSLPPLLLDDEEATAIAVGLRAAAGTSVAGIEEAALRALVKLEQVLPARLRRRVGALGMATTAVAPEGPTVDPQALSAIAFACRNGEGLRFDYLSRTGAESRRQVEPHSLVNLGRRWYLLAWDCERQDWRTFRVDRLSRPAANGKRFLPRELPGGSAADYVQSRLSAMPGRYEARVTVHAGAETVRRRFPARWGTIAPIDDRRCEFRAGDDDLGWLALRLLMLDLDFEVHEPPELIEQIAVLGERLAAAAAASGGGGR